MTNFTVVLFEDVARATPPCSNHGPDQPAAAHIPADPPPARAQLAEGSDDG